MEWKFGAVFMLAAVLLSACAADSPTDAETTDAIIDSTTARETTVLPETTAPVTTVPELTAKKPAETTAPQTEEKNTVKEYTVKMLDAAPTDWSAVEKAVMDETPWVKDYIPVTYAQIVFVKGDGFYVRMTCEEKDPKATYTKWMDPVYNDSCMEFFVSFDPENKNYMNVEVNSLGTALSAYGVKGKRTTLSDIIGYPLVVQAEAKDTEWSILIHLTLAEIEKVFGVKPETFVSGYAFRANFYKCGDKTAVVHYNMWNRVDTPKPSYHEPKYFGKLILG